MCGLGGIIRIHPPGAVPPPEKAIPARWLDLLEAGIAHRGPDGNGRFRDRVTAPDGAVTDIALVHRRLTILDAPGGGQPMQWRDLQSDRRIALVFNGLIYNHRELRDQLRALGVRFESDHSDTETLLHAWRKWGVGQRASAEGLTGGACERLSDMFAFAAWESAAGTLTLARDRFGQKPLYWAALDDARTWAFSSVATPLYALLLAAGSRLMPDPCALARWIRYGAWQDPPVQRVRAVRPSTMLVLGPSPPREIPFAPAPLAGGAPPPRDAPLTLDALDHALRAAVHQRLEADVPLGCFLSGGVDSSLIASYAREVRPDLATFSVRMPDPRTDESAFARRAAQALGTRHHTLECDSQPAADLLRLIPQLGLPFGDSSLLPTHWLSRAVRDHATVALSGDGGDELFAGYDRHTAAARVGRMAPLLALWPVGPGARPASRRSRAARLADACRHDGYLDLVSIFPRSMLDVLGVREQTTLAERVPWDLAAALHHDQTCYLPDDLLTKSDSASMAAALEVRAPFLDANVVALANRATLESLVPGGERKGLLRALARRRLPPEIINRPKQGFAIPLGEWFRTDFGGLGTLLSDTLGGVDPFPAGVLGLTFNRTFVQQLVDEHRAGTRDHAQRLYMLLTLSIFAKSLAAVS